MKRTLLLTTLFLMMLKTWSQKYDEIRGAENLAQGYTSLNKENPFSLFNHTASTVYGDTNFVALEYKNRFNLKETNTVSFCVGKNFNSLFLGAGFKRFGSEIFNENQFLIGVAQKTTDNLAIGLNIGTYYTSIQHQIQHYTILSNISIRYKVSHILECGSNLLISKNNLKNYSELKLGAKLNLAPSFSWNIELLQNQKAKPQLYTGINYQYEKYLQIRVGSYQQFKAFTAGLGIRFSETDLNFYTEHIVNTGWSNGISLNHVF